MPRVAYLVHDLNDPAVARRVTMMVAGGADVRVIGFYRGETPPATVAGAPVTPLARTADAQFVQRIMAVIRNLVQAGPMLDASRDADIVIGRNLEALALAARVKRSLPHARLVYECLDIHRLLLSKAVPARMIQRVEAALLGGIDLLIVSSPAFLREHFDRRPTLTAPSLLVENKLLAIDTAPPVPGPAPAGPPWTIGWLGNLRCRKTFDVLSGLVRRHDGRVRLLVAGRPTPAVFDDLAGQLVALPHTEFLGAYRPEDQPGIYARCHFAWAIDWFEEGLNSAWLLPNRLYEAQAFGTVPIALRSVETGRWLAKHDAGLLLDDALDDLDARLAALDASGYARLRAAVAGIAPSDLIADRDECRKLVDALSGGGQV